MFITSSCSPLDLFKNYETVEALTNDWWPQKSSRPADKIIKILVDNRLPSAQIVKFKLNIISLKKNISHSFHHLWTGLSFCYGGN